MPNRSQADTALSVLGTLRGRNQRPRWGRRLLVAGLCVGGLGLAGIAAVFVARQFGNGNNVAGKDAAGGSASLQFPLPSLPAEMKWPDGNKAGIERAVAEYGSDPVSACLLFDDALQREAKALSPEQQEWLVQATAVARRRAIEALQRDWETAVQTGDLRNATIVDVVRDKVEQKKPSDTATRLAALREQFLKNKALVQPAWEISNVRARFLQGEYTEELEGSSVDAAPRSFAITPRNYYRLVRVGASVKNISSESDLPYQVWAIGKMKGMLLRMSLGVSDKDRTGPWRLAVDEFIFLVAPDGKTYPCGHVCKGCKALRGFTVTEYQQEAAFRAGVPTYLVCSGTHVKQGESYDLDVVFSVPRRFEELQLLILGAPPVAIPLSGN